MRSFNIAVFAGDGIGEEITKPCVDILDQVISKVGGFKTKYEWLSAGAAYYLETGESLPQSSMDKARDADAILLSAMGLPDVRYPDGTEISPQIEIRMELGLYAGVRPVRAIPGIPPALFNPESHDLDFVIIRESTEGLFASHGKGEIINNKTATDTMVITRDVSERLFDFSLKLGQKRKAQGLSSTVTCVDKANVFKSFAFFRSIFNERAAGFSDIETNHMYIDATALNMVQKPHRLGILVTENMFGDILSDLGAGLIGGMGYAPSADIGDDNAVFQPCHGTAPDIAGKGLANPTAMFLSGAMMLSWLGEKHDFEPATKAGQMLQEAVDLAFSGGDLVTTELGGSAGTMDVYNAVSSALDTL